MTDSLSSCARLLRALAHRVPSATIRDILPDWWDDSCTSDESLLLELEFRVARYCGVSLATVRLWVSVDLDERT